MLHITITFGFSSTFFCVEANDDFSFGDFSKCREIERNTQRKETPFMIDINMTLEQFI